MFCAGTALAQSLDTWYVGATPCPIQDVRADPVYTLGVGYVLPVKTMNGQDWSVLELDLHTEVFYYRDILCGDLDFQLDFQSVVPVDDSGLELSGPLLALSLDSRWTWRYVNDSAVQVRIEPGLYSAIQTINLESLAMPISITGTKTLHPALAVVAGLSLRMRYERVVMPLAGLVWQPADYFRLEALVPSGRMIFYFSPEWSCRFFWDWDSMTYQLPDDDFDRKRVTLEENRIGLGVTTVMTPEFRIGVDVGVTGGRSVEFERGGNTDVDRAFFFRIGAGGAF
jgi:hypothetical protein